MMLRNALRFCPQVFLAAALLISVPHLAYSDATTSESASGEASGAAGGSGNSSANESTGGGITGETDGDNGSATADSASHADANSGPASADGDTTSNSTASVENGVSNAQSTATADITAGGNNILLNATANAQFGDGPNSASAQTSVNGAPTTAASVERGISATAFVNDPVNGYTKTDGSKKKSIAIAILPDGTYSIAVATKNGSYAKAGVAANGPSGNFMSFRGRDLYSAVRAAVSAFAIAERDYAESGSKARGFGFDNGNNDSDNDYRSLIGRDFGWAKVGVKSKTHACVGQRCYPQKEMEQIARLRCSWNEPARSLECPHFEATRSDYASMRR